jgi:hypothetical protein
MIRYLIKRLFLRSRRDKLPKLMRGLRRKMDYRTVADDEIALALMSGRFRDADHVVRFMTLHEISTAAEALALLPKRPPVDWRARLRRLLMSMEGSYQTDPYKREWERAVSGERKF